MIESVDSLELAQRLDRIAAESSPKSRLRILLQVNVDDDPAKSGFGPAALVRRPPGDPGAAGARRRRLMTVGRLVDDPEAARLTFVALRELSERLRSDHPASVPTCDGDDRRLSDRHRGGSDHRPDRSRDLRGPTGATLDSASMGAAFLTNFIRFVLYALWLLILARVILSWIDPGGRGTIARFVNQTTEPILAPVRRLLPQTGMLDLSAFVVLLVIARSCEPSADPGACRGAAEGRGMIPAWSRPAAGRLLGDWLMVRARGSHPRVTGSNPVSPTIPLGLMRFRLPSLLREREFGLFWLGQTVSSRRPDLVPRAADRRGADPQRGSRRDGLLTARARAAPVFALPAGAWLDRFDAVDA